MKISQLFNVSQIELANFHYVTNALTRAFAACTILLCIPICILNCLRCFAKAASPLSRGTTNDLLGNAYHYPVFNHGFLRHHLILLIIVKGDMNWVGLPRDVSTTSCLDCCTDMKVGLVSLYGFRQLTGISTSSVHIDSLQQSQFSMMDRASLLARVLIASIIFRTKDLSVETSFRLFGIRVDNVTIDQAVTKIVSLPSTQCIQTGCFVNVNSFNLMRQNTELSDAISACDFVFADGSGVRIAAQQRGSLVRGNVNGTDMLPLLCQRARSENQSIFLLGAEPGVASLTATNLQRQYPGLHIAGTHHGYFDKQASCDVIHAINATKADILLVALGSPTQECWLQKYKSMLKVNTAISVGGLFDFYSGRIPRAPIWMREMGVEWVWRLLQEPRKKFRRYVIGNPVFLFHCFFES